MLTHTLDPTEECLMDLACGGCQVGRGHVCKRTERWDLGWVHVQERMIWEMSWGRVWERKWGGRWDGLISWRYDGGSDKWMDHDAQSGIDRC